ncbi:MAG TPA: tetratricopeptide repeat protein, partial [Vicinamibacteria bacterium]|nr:tetratricopeptide repeat protein [Vicinamibacteria bacterium]
MTRLLLIGWVPMLLALQEPARSLYLEGREHLLEERYEQATEAFRRLVTEFADSEEADDAQYYLGYAYEQLGRDVEAIEAFGSVIERWPDSVRVESAREHRAELVAGRGRNDLAREVIDDIFGTASSWELKRDTAFALARQGNLAGRDVLEEAMERESSSRQIELIHILAPHVSNPEARGILILALDRSRSTSVTLRALKALEPASAQEEVTAAFERLLASGFSTSVKLEAIRTLSPRLDVASVRRAVSRGLDAGNASSVQLLACATLDRHLLAPEVRPAVLRVFQESYSSSVQLRCLESLAPMRNDLAAAEILHQAVAGANHASAVKLRAVQIAAGSTEPQVRAAARAALSREVSTSVQIPAVRVLGEGRNEPAAARALEDLFA